MTAAAQDRAAPAEAGGRPATLVLSGHEQAFEAILHRLAAGVRAFPGQQGLTVLRPGRRPGHLHDGRALRRRAGPGRVAGQ